MATIQDHRKKAILDTVINYGELGVMTRAKWLQMMNVKGWQAKEVTLRNYAAEEKLSTWLHDHRDDNSGNPNWPPTKHYLQEKQRLMDGIYKTEYRLFKDSSVYDLTKTEYEHFLNIQLAEDINTEKMELSNKIEAGIATDQELKEDENKDLEFFAKYARD